MAARMRNVHAGKEILVMKLGLLVVALALSTAAACDGLPLGAKGTRIDGVAVLGADGQVLASAAGSSGAVGQITVAPGAARTLSIQLSDEAGRPVALSPGSALEVRTAAPSIAEWRAAGTGTGDLVGVDSGTTALQVEYRFGDRVEYTSPPIPVVVP
jgi:hypothetical protein